MPNSLYGNAPKGPGMYGNALSARNQQQAQQLNLPGAIQQPGEAGQAGSQEAAQSDWANFEDVFNKNRGYAAKLVTDAAGLVKGTAGDAPLGEQNRANITPGKPIDRHVTKPEAMPMPDPAQGKHGNKPTRPAPPPEGTINPQAPPELQGSGLTGIQAKADMLKGYGDQSQATLGPGVGVVGGVQKQQVGQPQEVQSQSYAQEAVQPVLMPQQALAGFGAQKPPPGPDSDGDGVPDDPFAVGGSAPDVGNQAPIASVTPTALGLQPEANSQLSGQQNIANLLGGLDPQVNGKEAPTEKELADLDKLRKTNDLLVGYGGGVDSSGERREGDGGLDILQQLNPGAGQWDADIMNTGGGRTVFGDLQKQYGGKDKEKVAQIAKRMKETGEFRKSLKDQLAGFGGGGGGTGGQQSRDQEAATNRPDLDKARHSFMKGMAAYTIASQVPGAPQGSINGLGTPEQFLAALKSGAQFGDGGKWENMPGVKEQMDIASSSLGLAPDKLAEYFSKMNTTEWIDFWLLGVVPPWMEGATTYGYGKPGGWQAPMLEGVAGYGDDGGMWNAITNMWKDSAIMGVKAVAGGPAGVVGGGVDAATYRGPGAGKK